MRFVYVLLSHVLRLCIAALQYLSAGEDPMVRTVASGARSRESEAVDLPRIGARDPPRVRAFARSREVRRPPEVSVR